LIDKTGKRLRSFSISPVADTVGSIDPSSRGRILVTQNGRDKVAEYDTEGNKILEVAAPQATKAAALPNGPILVASSQGRRVYELDRAGKIVWEHKCDRVIWARRR
jgi:outer membrane protein assembly factor BamB